MIFFPLALKSCLSSKLPREKETKSFFSHEVVGLFLKLVILTQEEVKFQSKYCPNCVSVQILIVHSFLSFGSFQPPLQEPSTLNILTKEKKGGRKRCGKLHLKQPLKIRSGLLRNGCYQICWRTQRFQLNLKKDTTFHMSLYVHVFVTISALKPYST